MLKSQILFKKGDHEKALQLAKTTLEMCLNIGNSLIELDTRLLMAEILEDLGIISRNFSKYDEGLKQIHQCELLLLKLQDKSPTTILKRKARSLLIKGRILWRKEDPERAMIPLEQRLVLYEEIGDKHVIALVLRGLGTTHGEKGDPDRAVEYYQQSLALTEEIGDKPAMAICFNNIAIIFEEKGDIDKALEYFQKSLAIAKELDNKSDTIFYLINIGNAHNLKGDVGQAQESFPEAITIVKEFDTIDRLAGVLENIGMSFLYAAGDSNLGLDYSQKALTIFEEIDDAFGVARVLYFMDWACKLKGELELALEYDTRV